MAILSDADGGQLVLDSALVTREDIARAKDFILAEAHRENGTAVLASEWIEAQVGRLATEVRMDAEGAADSLQKHGRSAGLRLAFYQAVWELISSAQLLPAGATSGWAGPDITSRTSHGQNGLRIPGRLRCPFPEKIALPPLARSLPSSDVDVFLAESKLRDLHDGVLEAITQSLSCLRRGLYLPAIVMLAAGAEAAWFECGGAVATKLGNTKLRTVVDDPMVSLSRRVSAIKAVLSEQSAKELLRAAGTNLSRVTDAEVWTTTLRERRNAVHWGKAQTFIAQHSDASSLLLAAPLHVATLEAIRRAC
jgi:hypothetical protein